MLYFINERTVKISKINLEHEIITADLKSEEDFIFINTNYEIFRNDLKIKIKDNFIIKDPIISILSNDFFLLVNREFEHINSQNACIIDNEGNIKKSFFADSPLNIIATGERIVMTYSDSMLGTDSRFGNAQLVLFDFDGKCLFEYNSLEKTQDYITFLENKSLMVKDELTVYIMPYIGKDTDDFPIIELNILDYSTNLLFYAVDKNRSSNYFTAFSKKGDVWYFLENYEKPMSIAETSLTRIFKLNQNKHLELILSSSEISAIPRGVLNGEFAALTWSENSKVLNRINHIKV